MSSLGTREMGLVEPELNGPGGTCNITTVGLVEPVTNCCWPGGPVTETTVGLVEPVT